MSVQIVDYKQRENSEGETFISLIIEGDIEMVQSQETGRFYATARRASITSTFTEESAKRLIGKTLPGTIKKVDCEPYEYTVPESGEIITLSHRYEYQPEEQAEKPSMEQAVFQHSDNGAEKSHSI